MFTKERGTAERSLTRKLNSERQWKSVFIMRDQRMNLTVKRFINKHVLLPILLYGIHKWRTTKKNEQNIVTRIENSNSYCGKT